MKKSSRNFDENINHYKEDGSGFSEWFIADIAERNKKEFAKLPPEKQKDILDTWKERFPSGDGKINKKEILNFLASKVTDLHEYSKTRNIVAKHKKSVRNDSSMSR